MGRVVDLPSRDRPRERLLAHGVASLSDRELIALLLGTGGAIGIGAHVLAERLLVHFGSLDQLSRAHVAELMAVPGIGAAKGAALAAAFELGQRIGSDTSPAMINCTADLAALVAPRLRGLRRERMLVVVCNNANRVLAVEPVSEGSADRSLLPVREVLVTVLRRDGQAFGLAHNHPSGDPTPSTTDTTSTARVVEAAHALGLRFLEHVIIAGTRWQRVHS
ncbi:MAG: DNA repair protein RadC [Actinobacteria bacterium]|nr:DNA repair protein RadC [Actinomycetota bacterium]